ncbi:hypothetical protein, conserved [Leishmania tarentolae]|uniref:Uncharacterized protein n=1 Tax=Leishmania tarentolae TaxID=5689 RepID=A0A640KDD4_LEITA|nr:hypothetical protein, conserved [Leishmania tarentolae]
MPPVRQQYWPHHRQLLGKQSQRAHLCQHSCCFCGSQGAAYAVEAGTALSSTLSAEGAGGAVSSVPVGGEVAHALPRCCTAAAAARISASLSARTHSEAAVVMMPFLWRRPPSASLKCFSRLVRSALTPRTARSSGVMVRTRRYTCTSTASSDGPAEVADAGEAAGAAGTDEGARRSGRNFFTSGSSTGSAEAGRFSGDAFLGLACAGRLPLNLSSSRGAIKNFVTPAATSACESEMCTLMPRALMTARRRSFVSFAIFSDTSVSIGSGNPLKPARAARRLPLLPARP